MGETVWMIWDDHDKKRKPVAKVNEAYGYYHETRGTRPTTIMMHPETAQAFHEDGKTTRVDSRLEIREATHLGRNTFYVGVE